MFRCLRIVEIKAFKKVRKSNHRSFHFFFLFSPLFFFSCHVSRREFLPVFLEMTVRPVRVHFKGNPVIPFYLDIAQQKTETRQILPTK